MDYYLFALFFELAFFSALLLKKDGYVLSLGVVFNAYSFLYFFVGLVFYESLINHWYKNDVLTQIKELCILAVLSFNIAYLLPLYFKPINNHIVSREMVKIICILGVFFQLILILKVGPIEFFTMGRVERFGVFSESKALLLLSNLLYISFVVAAVRYLATSDENDKKLFNFMAIFITIYAIATISRTHITIVAITVIYVYERSGRLSKKTIFTTMVTLAVMMLFFKGFLYGIFFETKNYEKFNPGEFINWIRNTIMVFDSAYYGNDADFTSYILTIKSIFLIDPKGEPLSHWFINNFYPDKVSAGLTYGFSAIAEGYMAFGAMGVIFHFFIFGLFFNIIHKSKSFFNIVLTLFIMFIMFRIFRSESYNFVRTFIWYYFYPLVFIFISDYILRRIKK